MALPFDLAPYCSQFLVVPPYCPCCGGECPVEQLCSEVVLFFVEQRVQWSLRLLGLLGTLVLLVWER